MTGGAGVATESQRASKRRYDDKTTQFIFRLRNDKDAFVISRLRAVPNKTAYLRALVISDANGGDSRTHETDARA